MKYYIPTSSLNFNNILSTESISPKVFYDRRDFGYTRWFSVEENNIEGATLLYRQPHMFQRPNSDVEDHAMLIEIITDDEYPQLSEGVYYTDKTIYLNPWQTNFYFFSDKVKRTVLSLSDSSLETKLVRLYQSKMSVAQFEGSYPIVSDSESIKANNIDANIEDDYIINKMKGLLYGYYIGANLSSTKEQVQKLDSLREIQNIFSSVISSYDRLPSDAQKARLDELFNYLERQQPIYKDLENEVGTAELVDKILGIFKRHGYVFRSFDKDKLVDGLQAESEYNPSMDWINREISKTNAYADSHRKLLNPDVAEIMVSAKERLYSQKKISDELMANLFKTWTNNVLCSHSYNGKVNSIKEDLSDDITKAAKGVLGEDWDSSPVRSYLNQLRRHVRGEEFNQTWDNGVLSSISAVLIKGDDWEQLHTFMQSKGMYDYRIAFAFYGVLNGFANLTRDFTDLLLNQESKYLSNVYREFDGQLHDRNIPTVIESPLKRDVHAEEKHPSFEATTIIQQDVPLTSIDSWKNQIRSYAATVIKRDKAKLLKSLEEALTQNGDNQDYFVFITMLDNFDGWKPGKNGPSTSWKRMQEHFVPDYDQKVGKNAKQVSAVKKPKQQERTLFDFDGVMEGIQNAAHTVVNALAGENVGNREVVESAPNTTPVTAKMVSRNGVSILEDTSWINECASLIADSRASRQFKEDMEWFVGNHNDTYNDKRKGVTPGYYAGHDRSNVRVQARMRAYMENKLKPRNDKMQWLADIYAKVPINRIMDYIEKVYGI